MSSSNTSRVSFPGKIYLILENESQDIIRWHSNNRAFRIVDPQRFEQEIIPKYFRHNQLSSVQRQLNLYGFRCVSRGEDKGCYYHSDFCRGDWEKAKLIRRGVYVCHDGGHHLKLPSDSRSMVDCANDSAMRVEKDLRIPEVSVDSLKQQEINVTSAEMMIAMDAHNKTLSSTNSDPAKSLRTDWLWPLHQHGFNTSLMRSFVSRDNTKAQEDENGKIPRINDQRVDEACCGMSSSVGTIVGDASVNCLISNRSECFPPRSEQHREVHAPHSCHSIEELWGLCEDLTHFLDDCESATLW